MNYNPPTSQWSWLDCNLILKRSSKKNQNQIYEILESEYMIQLEDDDTETDLNIEITMEKRINFEETGFTWHKSWNIPSIEVKISRRDLNSIKNQLDINRVYCEITAGYPIRKMVEFFLNEVPLEGETRKEIGSNGIARFSNLKFSQTSFSHERNKFSLIIVVFTKNQERSRSIIKSFISLPIYVDSRKEARKIAPTNKFLLDLIPIDCFKEDLEFRHQDKKIVKVKSKKSTRSDILEEDEEPDEEKRRGKYSIEMSLNGFVRYYSSANIRNKIKHPFYFCYHFSNFMQLYYNKEFVEDPLALLKALEKPIKNDQKKYILLVIDSKVNASEDFLEDMKKKISTLFENWKYYFIDVVINKSVYFNFTQNQKINSNKTKNGSEAKSQNQNADEKVEEEEKERKWVHMEKEELYDTYVQYNDYFESRELNGEMGMSESDSEKEEDRQLLREKKKLQNFEFHQILHIQDSFHQPGCGTKRVKIENFE